MIFASAQLWVALVFIVSIAASHLEPRFKSVLIGFRTVSAKQALIYQKAGNTLVWSPPLSSEQIGPGTYISPVVADWPTGPQNWVCAILADSDAWDLVNKAWVPEVDGCKPLWFGEGAPNLPTYLTDIGGPGFSIANTVLLSRIAPLDKFNKLQLTIPQQLQGASGGLSLLTQCVQYTDTAGVEALQAYGTVNWGSWVNVKGTVQTLD